ncbi:disease resistance protein RPV1-like isoform X2 [Cornus florida]|nr:disease resistance protein RPV1-like isoform X2 [Cornus florida]
MHGIGKTTIAKTVYNLNFDRFECSSFLANIREISKEPRGLVRLQRQLLYDILKRKETKISNVDEGIIKIREAICCKRILLVLDDVENQDQLNALLAMRSWFQQGSKIIITTTNEQLLNEQLLKAHGMHKRHRVEGFSHDESFQLFSWHAFGQDHPIEGYMEHTKKVVQYCSGHPLALQILGSSLCGRSVDVWESAIKKLEAIPDSRILKKLKISFDSLQDDHDKNLFLDISCFFVRMDKDFIITILDECDFCTKVGIQNLIDRCLLTIDRQNKLTMHQLIRDMGREIVRQESPKEPGKRSRVWHNKDALNVLREKTGTEKIEGLILNLHVSGHYWPTQNFFGLDNSKRRHSEDFLDKLTFPCGSNSSKRRRLGIFSWFPTNSALTESLSTSKEVYLKTDAFSRMHKLRILHLNDALVTGDYKEFPRKLRWLCWRGSPLKLIPNEFILESLVALDMRYSCLKQVWKGIKALPSLRILDLSHSHGLKNTPNFSEVPNLERLFLKDCINLIEVHESIGKLERLVLLNLKGCKNLRNLPTKIGHLKSLEKLILCGCSNLDKLPRELCQMESLKVLDADGVAIKQLTSSSSDIESEHSGWFSGWFSWPRKSPESISCSLVCLPRSLVSLNLSHCNLSDDAIPRDLGSLSLLQHLDLGGNPISSLPESIKGLAMLHSLELGGCKGLQLLPELPMCLRRLNLRNCTSLEIMINLPKPLFSLSRLSVLALGCDKLVEGQNWFRSEPIQNIDAEMIKNLGLVELESIGKVDVYNHLTRMYNIGPIQALYECGIVSIFHTGNEVPCWFSKKSRKSSICFNVPSLPNLKIRGLNVCVVVVVYAMGYSSPKWTSIIKIFNKTKDVKWAYSPGCQGIPDDGKRMRWSSHWKIGNQLEVGDEVVVSVMMSVNYVSEDLWDYEVKELGVDIVYEEEEKDTQLSYSTSCPDLSAYQFSKGRYSLGHHHMFRAYLERHLSSIQT